MATRTIGTNANNSLTAIQFGSIANFNDADVAAIAVAIKDDYAAMPSYLTEPIPVSPRIFPGAFSRSGVLIVPNRGTLQVYPGDWVAFDSVSGWPILISKQAVQVGGSLWTHT